MADIRPVTPDFAVAPQLTPEDMVDVAARGFTLVINNRPDGEVEGQPTSAKIKVAAEAAGLHYLHIPVRGGPNAEQIEAVREATLHAHGPVLAFCRSGTRSINAWSIGQAGADTRSREALIALGHTAGYDISGVLL